MLLPAIRFHERFYARLALAFRNEIELIQYQPARFVMQCFIVTLQFGDNRFRVADGIGIGVERRDVDDVQQHARALQMSQELVTEPRAIGRAFDEAGDIGEHEAPVLIGAHNTQVRRKRRERIIGDLGPCRGYRADERALSGVGHAEKANVGQHLEFEMQPPLLALFTGCELAWGAVRARFEVNIAETAHSAFGKERLLLVCG